MDRQLNIDHGDRNEVSGRKEQAHNVERGAVHRIATWPSNLSLPTTYFYLMTRSDLQLFSAT